MNRLSKKLSFPKESFNTLSNIETKNWWFLSRNKIISWILTSKVTQFDRFLEIGCGTGFVLNHLSRCFPNTQFFGSELHAEGLEIAKYRNKGLKFSNLDARHLREIEMYDVIGAFDVLEHIKEDQLVLNNLYKAIKANGHLIITVPQHPSLWSSLDEKSFHCRRYTRTELTEKLRISGFKTLYSSSFVTFLLPLMYISRKFKQNPQTDIISEFEITPTTNFFLKCIMNLEISLLKLGICWPLGGSLLILTQKT